MNWIAIGTIDDIPLRGARCVKTPQGKIGVFRTAENEVYAIEDHCPHKGGGRLVKRDHDHRLGIGRGDRRHRRVEGHFTPRHAG